MSLVIFDSATRSKRAFEPQDPERVTMYVCGPTVWSYAHIGNARPAVVFDTLFRVLRDLYGPDHVSYARNITDVDDKINAAASEEGVEISVITEKFARIYREDTGALNVLPMTYEPTATGHMDEMIALMGRLVERGHAYQSEGHVLFDVTSFDEYGALSGRALEDMVAGARVEVASYKRNPADFVLWKPSKPGEPVWDSPFGPGRPGWHLECSAMIRANLGQTIDIHGGGQDLKFPHHENEIAQSVCAHGAPLARYWMHNGFLDIDAEKMSKSLGNVKLVHDLIKTWPGEVLRYALLSGHYRAPLNWTQELLEQSKASLDRLYTALEALDGVEAAQGARADAVVAALHDDLNTPKAFAELFALAGAANKAGAPHERATLKGALVHAGSLLGLFTHKPADWFRLGGEAGGLSDADIDAQLEERQAARAARDFAKADAIRDALAKAGIVIEDGPEGARWKRG